MDVRNGQVQDYLDLLIIEQLFRRAGLRHAKCLSLGLGTFGHEVGTRDYLYIVEHCPVFEVDAADLAATDDADPDRRFFTDNRFLLVVGEKSIWRLRLFSPTRANLFYRNLAILKGRFVARI